MSDTQPRYELDQATGEWRMYIPGRGWLPVPMYDPNIPLDEQGPAVMKDVGEFERQRNPHSSDGFLQQEFATPEEQRQSLRRMRAMGAEVDSLIRSMVDPQNVRGPNLKSISDEAWLQFQKHPESWRDEGFKPFSQYAHLIMPQPPKKLIRYPYKGEVGVVEKYDEQGRPDLNNSYILVLEAGSTAVSVQVPVSVRPAGTILGPTGMPLSATPQVNEIPRERSQPFPSQIHTPFEDEDYPDEGYVKTRGT